MSGPQLLLLSLTLFHLHSTSWQLFPHIGWHFFLCFPLDVPSLFWFLPLAALRQTVWVKSTVKEQRCMQTGVQQTQFILEFWTDSKGLIMVFFQPLKWNLLCLISTLMGGQVEINFIIIVVILRKSTFSVLSKACCHRAAAAAAATVCFRLPMHHLMNFTSLSRWCGFQQLLKIVMPLQFTSV